jgi:hypothetical protein
VKLLNKINFNYFKINLLLVIRRFSIFRIYQVLKDLYLHLSHHCINLQFLNNLLNVIVHDHFYRRKMK